MTAKRKISRRPKLGTPSIYLITQIEKLMEVIPLARDTLQNMARAEQLWNERVRLDEHFSVINTCLKEHGEELSAVYQAIMQARGESNERLRVIERDIEKIQKYVGELSRPRVCGDRHSFAATASTCIRKHGHSGRHMDASTFVWEPHEAQA